jgi:hypothetical protein
MRKMLNTAMPVKRKAYAPPAPVPVKAVNAIEPTATRAEPTRRATVEVRCIVFIVSAPAVLKMKPTLIMSGIGSSTCGSRETSGVPAIWH